MGWPVYTAHFEAARPLSADRIPEPAIHAKTVAASLDWMDPTLVFTADRIAVRLSVHAPSADAALAHVRGSLRSALHGAGVPAIGRWPLVSLSVGPADDADTDNTARRRQPSTRVPE